MAALEGTNEQILTQLAPIIAGNDLGEQGVERLAKILSGMQAGGVPSNASNLTSQSLAVWITIQGRFSKLF